VAAVRSAIVAQRRRLQVLVNLMSAIYYMATVMGGAVVNLRGTSAYDPTCVLLRSRVVQALYIEDGGAHDLAIRRLSTLRLRLTSRASSKALVQ